MKHSLPRFIGYLTGSLLLMGSIQASTAPLRIAAVSHDGRDCLQVITPWATLYFEDHEGSSGFKSVVDREGFDWLQANMGFGYESEWGFSGEWRGFPNATDGNFGHASRPSGSVNSVIKDTPDHIIIRSENESMGFDYHFFPSHGAIEVFKATERYCFLWEGTNGGSCEEEDFVVFSDGVKRHMTGQNFHMDIPDEWLYFGDPKRESIMVLAKHPDDDLLDENWRDLRNYELYSFGRGNGKDSPPWGERSLEGTEHYLVYTFLPRETAHADVAEWVEQMLNAPFQAIPSE